MIGKDTTTMLGSPLIKFKDTVEEVRELELPVDTSGEQHQKGNEPDLATSSP